MYYNNQMGYMAVQQDYLTLEENGGGGGGGYVRDYNPPADDIYKDVDIYQDLGGGGDSSGGGGGAVDVLPQTTNPLIKPMGSSVNVYVRDKKTGKQIAAKVILFDAVSGEMFDAILIPDNDFVNMSAGAYPDFQVKAEFSARGYNAAAFSIEELKLLQEPATVYLHKGINWILIGAAVAVFIAFAKKRKKEVGKVTSADVFPFLLIGGGLLAFDLVKKILEFLGVWESKDSKDLDQAATDSGSFWNPNYWKSVKPANKNWTYAISAATAQAWSKEIYDSFGAFNDCEECVIAVFKRCRTKANASFLADIFQQVYGQDLLTFLRGGWWPQDRLSDSDVNVINKYINSLPAY